MTQLPSDRVRLLLRRAARLPQLERHQLLVGLIQLSQRLDRNDDPVCWVTILYTDGGSTENPHRQPFQTSRPYVSLPVKWCDQCRGWFSP